MVRLGETLPAAEPRLEKMVLFEAGKGGHRLYRIAGLVVTARGNILAYYKARNHTGLDGDDIDILLRRSTDGGKNWSESQTLPLPTGRLERSPAAVERRP